MLNGIGISMAYDVARERAERLRQEAVLANGPVALGRRRRRGRRLLRDRSSVPAELRPISTLLGR